MPDGQRGNASRPDDPDHRRRFLDAPTMRYRAPYRLRHALAGNRDRIVMVDFDGLVMGRFSRWSIAYATYRYATERDGDVPYAEELVKTWMSQLDHAIALERTAKHRDAVARSRAAGNAKLAKRRRDRTAISRWFGTGDNTE